MKKITIVSLFLLILFFSKDICFSQTGWFPLTGGSGTLYEAFFINDNTGWIVGSSSRIFKTTSGGQLWQMQNTSAYSTFYDVQFLNINTGWIVGANKTIIKTTNSGINWITQMTTGVDNIYSISFINENTGWAGSSWGKIFKTTNSGVNWIEINNAGSNNNAYIEFHDINTGYIGDHGGNILRTTNGGFNWELFDIDTAYTFTINALQMMNNNTGYCGTSAGIIYKTTDGIQWHRMLVTPGHLLTSFTGLSFINENTGWASAVNSNQPTSSKCYKTTNGGVSWMWSTLGVTDYVQGIHFASVNVGYAIGNSGIILKTTNGGNPDFYSMSYYRTGVNKTINDLQYTSDTINVNLSENLINYNLFDVNITIDTIIHSNDSDLEIYLIHEGITDTLIFQVGGSGDNFIRTILNDSSSIPIENGTPPFTGQFKPSKPLSQFLSYNPDGNWFLKIYDRASGNTGMLKAWSIRLIMQNPIGIKQVNNQVPKEFTLYQNYPNPFNPATTIRFALPPSPQGEGLGVRVIIYDILGREVATLVNEQLQPGIYEVEWDGSNYSSGLYFYTLIAAKYTETKKMLLIK